MQKKIVWQSYHVDNMEKSEREKMLEEVDRDDLDEEGQQCYDEIESVIEVMETPLGLVMKNDSLNPINSIEHRICHTNFSIGEREATRVNFIEGVETLSVISRYQMLVGFGSLFSASEVRKEIEQALFQMESYSEDDFLRDLGILEKRL